MTRIWYDTADDRLVIEGALQTYAPRTLMVVCDGDQIMVRLKVNARNEFGPASYTTITDAAGGGFSDCPSAVAYLTGIFSMERALSATFVQAAASVTWLIRHGLGFRPNVSVIDSAGDLCLADLAWPDAATVLVSFGAPTAGTAYLS